MGEITKLKLRTLRLNLGILALPLILIPSTSFSNTEEVVNQFIQDQFNDPQSGMVSDIEHGQLKDFFETDENNISVFWLYGVANYWEYRVTLLSSDGTTYTENTTLKIPGISESVELDGEILIVKYLDYGPSDPRCCPSINRIKRYKVTDSRYLEF